jgi:hypothetical protein
MPRGDVAAAQPEGAKSGQVAEQPGTSSPVEVSSAVPQSTASELLQSAGVPEEVISALGAREQAAPVPHGTEVPQPDTEASAQTPAEVEQPEPEAEEAEPSEEGETETEADATEPTEEPEEEPEPGEDEQEPEGEQKPSWFQKRRAKWKRKEERLQDQIDDLTEQLARSNQKQPEPQPATATARPGKDVFADIQDINQLQEVVSMQRQVRDWCMDHPEGVVVNEGQANEKVISPEEVRKTLIGATRMIEDAPVAAQRIQMRQQWNGLARAEWPELFDTKSNVHQTAQQFLKEHPGIAESPARDFVLGLMVEGWKAYQPRMEAAMRGQQPNGAAQANGKIPEALKRKIPPIPKTQAPNPPRGSRVPSPIKNAAAAVERVVAEGASPESVQDAIAAIERQNAASGGARRTPAPV